jgi:hypothetical protein
VATKFFLTSFEVVVTVPDLPPDLPENPQAFEGLLDEGPRVHSFHIVRSDG